ncbi:MAG: hypothetical protein ACE5HA_03305 [Anaerolineae bacterium]
MPEVDSQTMLQELARRSLLDTQARIDTATAPKREARANVFESLGSGFARENLFFNLGGVFSRSKFLPEPDYNALDPEQEDLSDYQDLWREFTHSRSRIETEAIKAQIDQERIGLRKGADHPIAHFFGSALGGVLSPETFIPVGGVIAKGVTGVRISRALITGLRTAAVAATAQTASEMALSRAQLTRTDEESLTNIAFAALMGGALGTGFGAAAASRRALAEAMMSDDFVARIKAKLPSQDKLKALGPEGHRAVVMEAIRETIPEAEDLLSKGLMGKFINRYFRISPMVRGLSDQTSPTMRVTTSQLLEQAFYRKVPELGAPAETLITLEDAAVGVARIRTLDIFDAYRARGRKGRAIQSMDEANELATMANRRGGKARDLPHNGEQLTEPAGVRMVEDIARIHREFYSHIEELGLANGSISPSDLIENWVHRIWDAEAIKANPEEFTRRLAEDFASDGRTSLVEALADAKHTMEAILGGPADSSQVHLLIRSRVGEASSFKDRLLDIDDTKYEDFLINDADEIAFRLQTTAIPQLIMAQKFRTDTSGAVTGVWKRASGVIDEALERADAEILVAAREDVVDAQIASSLGALLDPEASKLAKQLLALGQRRLAALRGVRSSLIELEPAQRLAQAVTGAQKVLSGAPKRIKAIAGLLPAKVQKLIVKDIEARTRLPEARARVRKLETAVRRAEMAAKDTRQKLKTVEAEARRRGAEFDRKRAALETKRQAAKRELGRLQAKIPAAEEGLRTAKRTQATGGRAVRKAEANLQRAREAVKAARAQLAALRQEGATAARIRRQATQINRAVKARETAAKRLSAARKALSGHKRAVARGTKELAALVSASKRILRQRPSVTAPSLVTPGLRRLPPSFAARLAKLRKAAPAAETAQKQVKKALKEQQVALSGLEKAAKTTQPDLYRLIRDVIFRRQRVTSGAREALEVTTERAVKVRAAVAELREAQDLMRAVKGRQEAIAKDAERLAFIHQGLEAEHKAVTRKIADLRRVSRGKLKGTGEDAPPIKVQHPEVKEADIEQAGAVILRRAANVRRAESRRGVTLEPLIRKIQNEYKAAIRGERNFRKRKRLERRAARALKDIKHIRDHLLRKGAMPEDPSHLFSVAERSMRNVNVARFLGGVVPASIADVAMPTFVGGMGSHLRQLAVTMRMPLLRIAKDHEDIVRLSMALESTRGGMSMRVRRFADLAHLGHAANPFEKGTQWLADKLMSAFGLRMWNQWHKGSASIGIAFRLMDDVAALAQGRASPRAVKRLSIGAIDEHTAKAIHAQWLKYRQADKFAGMTTYWPRSQMWDDLDAKRAFHAAVLTDVQRTIITPSVGELPVWMSKEYVRLLGQFRAFAMSATHKIVMSGLQRRDAAVYAGSIFMTAMGTVTYMAKSVAAGREIDMSPGRLVLEGLDRSGILGALGEVNSIFERVSRGNLGLGPMLGVEGGISRANARNVVRQAFGPSVRQVFDLARLFSMPFKDEFTHSDLRHLVRMAPGSNIFYLQRMMDMTTDAASDRLGLPDRSTRP